MFHPSGARLRAQAGLALFLFCALLSTAAHAAPAREALSWTTEATQPTRFLAVHGRRSALFGYSSGGLEAWAYPLQILTSYRVAFVQQGAATEIEGVAVLRRIVYEPHAVTRSYVGPDFVVRETLFVPLDAPGAIVTYESDGVRPVDVVVRFVPVLDLMWPGGIGGQETGWNAASSAYLISEPTHRFTAIVGSPDTVAHDDTPNATRPVARSPGLAFTIRADKSRSARVVIASADARDDAPAVAKRLLTQSDSLEKAARDHYDALLNHALQIETPDAEVNRALAWSTVALDQAWVCNPDLGCGEVAGYGPSRKARRPQYDWFFAGDGMVATRALLASGQYERAREELEFILKYQNRTTGMIWHEMSQSAGQLDWSRYPYMFVHVDITFDFLDTAAEYAVTTGDTDFVKRHWPAIQSAYRYCQSVLDSKDGLPRIPSDKEGFNEQDALSEELTLSASWVAAAEGFAKLAAVMGRDSAVTSAHGASQRAREAIGRRFWDESHRFWISGYTRARAAVADRDIRPIGVLKNQLFTPAQRSTVLDQLASSEFQTDWGTRSKASSDRAYDPNSYASGSVWALGTSTVASAFWGDHRPATAWAIWDALVSWSALDSLGHMHETLAGDVYHEEVESVPEQTWSSSAFLSAAVEGLLGLKVDGAARHLMFAPHLPPQWPAIRLNHVRVNGSDLMLDMIQSADGIQLQIENSGEPIQMTFAPQLPLGATLREVKLAGRALPATLEQHPQDTHARVELTVPHGGSSLTMSHAGGVSIIPPPSPPVVGEASNGLKIVGMHMQGRSLTIDLDHRSTGASIELHTPWRIADAQGAKIAPVGPGIYRLVTAPSADGAPAFTRSTIGVRFVDD